MLYFHYEYLLSALQEHAASNATPITDRNPMLYTVAGWMVQDRREISKLLMQFAQDQLLPLNWTRSEIYIGHENLRQARYSVRWVGECGPLSHAQPSFYGSRCTHNEYGGNVYKVQNSKKWGLNFWVSLQ